MRTRGLAIALICAAGLVRAENAEDIIRRSVRRDQDNFRLARQYTFLQHADVKVLDPKGKLKHTERETHEILILFQEPYERLIEKDGKPLPPKDVRKEQEKLDKFTAKREKETPEQRRKRLAELEKEKDDEWKFLQEIPEAYRFALAGSETIGGREAWRIEATPKEDFRPKHSKAKVLAKFKGTIWVDKAESHWLKMEAENIETVSFGAIIARLAKGSWIRFEQTRVNDEVWLPKRLEAKIGARLALLVNRTGELEITWDNYKKFQSESKILTTSEIH